MVMLSVYFDESYNQPTSKEPDMPLVYTIGGYLSTVQQWKAFQKEWSKTLKDAGIPFFHMADYESRFGFYKDWSDEKRIEVLQKLHTIINKYVLKGFATSILISDYEGLSAEQKFVFGEPHVCALISCMKHIAVLCDEFDITDRIAYVFENSRFNGRISTTFGNLSDEDNKGYRVGSLTFAQKECMPLQAADILAYEVTKEIARQKNQSNTRHTRKSIKNLAIHGIDELYYMEREHFVEVLTKAKEMGVYNGEI